MSETVAYQRLNKAAARLVAALAEEASLAQRSCRRPDDASLGEQWARARRHVEDCQESYSAELAVADFPDLKIRSLLEAY